MNVPAGWIPLKDAVKFINDNLMVADPRGVLDDWDSKYLNVRIDMRTGAAFIKKGNIFEESK
jgi:hypothetical protein